MLQGSVIETVGIYCYLNGPVPLKVRGPWLAKHSKERKEKEKIAQAAQHSLYQLRKRRHIGPKCRESSPSKEKENSWGSGGWLAAPCSRPRPWEQIVFCKHESWIQITADLNVYGLVAF